MSRRIVLEYNFLNYCLILLLLICRVISRELALSLDVATGIAPSASSSSACVSAKESFCTSSEMANTIEYLRNQNARIPLTQKQFVIAMKLAYEKVCGSREAFEGLQHIIILRNFQEFI